MSQTGQVGANVSDYDQVSMNMFSLILQCVPAKFIPASYQTTTADWFQVVSNCENQ